MKKTLLILSAIFLFFAGCRKDDVFEEGEVAYKFSVITRDVTDITSVSAKCDGAVELIAYDDEITVTARGVCWSTSQNPTISNSHTTDGNGTGNFTSSITGLTANTTYYVRAYATNEKGTSYGEEKSFTTMVNESMPVVTTNEVTDITQTTATSGGNVTSDGGANVTARGVCWSISQNPTINDNKTSDGSGTGSFTSNLINLNANTTYYVRAYATNEKGTSYGEQRSFTTLQNIELPTVTTTNVSNITQTTATSGGNVTSDGGANVTARGVCWSTSQNPTISNSHTTDGNGTGSFTSNITGLTANTTYYIRAYATNEKGTSYGEEKSFTTKGEPDYNGHEYVDLGLPSGLKWATCNVGADSPEDYGNYYAWGETETKSEYTESNSLTDGLTISELQSLGYIDGSGNLTPSHDAATANWGGSWRMPTKEELEELQNECTWAWTTQNGVNGRKVTGPNGNHIFLPAAGYRSGSSLYYTGEYGLYWSSTPNESNGNRACRLYFNSGNQYVIWSDRDYGQSVRPVSE